MSENRDSILSLIDIANTLPDVCSSPCIIELQSLIKQNEGGVATFSATSSITSEVSIGTKLSYDRLGATSSETRIADTISDYDTRILAEREALKLSLGDESYAGETYSAIEIKTADSGQTTEIYIKNYDNTNTYTKQITSQTDNTDMSDGTSYSNRNLSKDSFGVSIDNGTDTRSYIQGQVYPGSPDGSLVISVDAQPYSQNYENTISLTNQGANDGRIFIYQKDETQPYSSKIEMKTNTNTVEIRSENGTGLTPATDISNIVLTPTSIITSLTSSNGNFLSNLGTTSSVFEQTDNIGNSSVFSFQSTDLSLSSTDGVDTSTQTITAGNIELSTPLLSIPNLQAHDDNAGAIGAGLTAGNIYQTTGLGAAPLDVAGILMVVQ